MVHITCIPRPEYSSFSPFLRIPSAVLFSDLPADDSPISATSLHAGPLTRSRADVRQDQSQPETDYARLVQITPAGMSGSGWERRKKE